MMNLAVGEVEVLEESLVGAHSRYEVVIDHNAAKVQKMEVAQRCSNSVAWHTQKSRTTQSILRVRRIALLRLRPDSFRLVCRSSCSKASRLRSFTSTMDDS